MIKDRDIVIVGLQPWDTEIGSNCKNIAVEFAKNNRVLYVNSPLDRITKVRRKKEASIRKRIDILNGKGNNIELVQPNLWLYYPDVIIESINWIKITAIFNLLNRYNNKLISASISRAMIELSFENIILFNDNDIFRGFYLKDFLKPNFSIYYSRDYLLGVDYWRFHGKTLEPKLISKSDVCVANSIYLKDYCKQHNKNSYYVGQGCELEHFIGFNSISLPEDLQSIKKPIVGYVGALQSLRLDIDLIEYIASSLPDYSVVLVGPEDEEFQRSNLHNLINVYFTGLKRVDELPKYISSFDICINPQKINEVTIGNYPRKIDEYLALGKPTVATKTISMDVFADHVYLATTPSEYVRLIEKALSEDTKLLQDKRIKFAAGHTWEASVNEIYKAIALQNQF